jgi:hypothetical protein
MPKYSFSYHVGAKRKTVTVKAVCQEEAERKALVAIKENLTMRGKEIEARDVGLRFLSRLGEESP